MKHQLIRSLQVCALLIALAITSSAEESKRGLYEGNVAGGGKIVFFIRFIAFLGPFGGVLAGAGGNVAWNANRAS